MWLTFEKLTKECARYVISLVEERLSPLSGRRNVVTPTLQILIALRYYAKGCYQIELGDLHGVSQPTVSRIVASVSRVLADLLPQFIKFPPRIETLQQEFYNVACFPMAVGCIDCTHAGRIRGILLGDSGYPCKPYLLTPILNHRNPCEERYNASHIRTRTIVERCFGEWKGMFRALQNGMQISLCTAKTAIIAMAVLYNIKKNFYDNNPYVKARVACGSGQLRRISFQLVNLGKIFNCTKQFTTNVQIVAFQQSGNVPICYKQLKPHSGTFPAET
nr:PREDICTED: putative nuclease HARBI1 [Linepithema humile]